MTIGTTPSTNYYYEGTLGKINGYNSSLPSSYGGAGSVQQNLGASVAFFLITAKNGSASARDLRTQTGSGGAIEAIFRNLPQGILAYFITNDNSGVISIVVDGVNAPTAASLQSALQALGTVNGMDISGTTVTLGTSFVVA